MKSCLDASGVREQVAEAGTPTRKQKKSGWRLDIDEDAVIGFIR